MKCFGPPEWNAYWLGKREIDGVYSNRDRIVRRLAAHGTLEGKKVLEVGAGSGRDGLAVAELSATVYLLDFSAEALLSIREREKLGRAFVVCGDACALPFPEESLDVVFSQGLLEHLADARLFLAESFRVLGKGGVLLVDVPQTFHPYTLAKLFLQASGKWFAGRETQYTMKALCHLAEDARFTVESRYGDWMVPSFFYRSLRHVCQVVGLANLPPVPQASRVGSERGEGHPYAARRHLATSL